MYYIYSRSRESFVASINIDAFELYISLTDDTRFAIECDFNFICWLHQFDALSSYDLMPVRVCTDG